MQQEKTLASIKKHLVTVTIDKSLLITADKSLTDLDSITPTFVVHLFHLKAAAALIHVRKKFIDSIWPNDKKGYMTIRN